MKRCGVTRRETTRRMEHRDKDRQTESDTAEGLRRIKLWTMAMRSLIEGLLHSQLLMVHFFLTKKPLKQRLLVSCAPDFALSCRAAGERETFENHTAAMLLRSSALKRRLNKAVKKLIPLGGHACKHTQMQTREPGATENAG